MDILKVHLFISYSHVDQDKIFVNKLVNRLEAIFDPSSVWYDGKIPAGVDWDKAINDAIKRCNIFIYVLSEDSLKSKACIKEFRRALRRRKFLLPVLISGDNKFSSAPNDIKIKLEATQYVDMSDGIENDTAFNRLVQAIYIAWVKYLIRRFVIFALFIVGIFSVAFMLYYISTTDVSVFAPTATQKSTALTLSLTPSPTSVTTHTLTLSLKSTSTPTRTFTPTRPTASVAPDIAATETFDALNTRQATRLTPTHTRTPLPTCTPTSTPDANLAPDKTATSKFETLEANYGAIQGATFTPMLTPLPDGCLS